MVQEVTSWRDPVEVKTYLVEASNQKYEVLVEEKRVGNDEGARSSRKFDTRGAQRMEETNTTLTHNERGKGKGNPLNFKIFLEIEQERILDNQVEFTLREVLNIAKREFRDAIINTVKRKRMSTKQEVVKPMNVNTVSIEMLEANENYMDGHYTRPHWARTTMET